MPNFSVRRIKHDGKDEREKDRFKERSNEKVTEIDRQGSESQEKGKRRSTSRDVMVPEHEHLTWMIALLGDCRPFLS